MQTVYLKHLFHLSLFSLLFFTSKATYDPSLTSSSTSLIISRFQEYLRINTAYPNPKYYEAVEFILSQAKSLSLESQIIEFVKDKPLVLLKWPGKDSKLPSVLLNSHTDVVPAEPHKWTHHPFSAHIDSHGNIYARGSQDMKCVGMQYLEAIRKLKASGFEPTRTIYLSFVPDEENGGLDGAEKLAESDVFQRMKVAFVLDEGMPSPDENYLAYYAERSLMWLVIKATGAPGHGAKLYDNTAMENVLKSIESIRIFRDSQFDLVKAGLKAEGDVVSVNMVFLKAGTQTPTFIQKDPLLDKFGKPILTVADSSNPWWFLFEEAIRSADGKVGKAEILLGSTDASFFRQRGLPAIGFSAIANTPERVHDHNEFLNQEEYLKGVDIYESIIKAYASYAAHTEAEASKYEL
ncbi:uncharacterized protein LOC104904089 isoform X2 [Beta vulgaris subsp. vulgaris]|uniref:uncharacterized protein LOC104904089 isoform X2 n=1 Tax=Beta vulgaris subsp. vulgaris TaxID=3555 RepID=UPI00053F3B34|nr:uncharacterized protein LOC104904089 isoform X2 [Beta vulgaris subsp. vulgaris]